MRETASLSLPGFESTNDPASVEKRACGPFPAQGEAELSDDELLARFPLRDYQQKGVGDTWKWFHEEHEGKGPFRKILGVAATGAGKTRMFAELTRRAVASGGKTLILVDQEPLIDQTRKAIFKFSNIVCDVEQGTNHASDRASCVVATVQSIGNRLAKYGNDHFDLVILDECDRSVADSWQAVVKYFDGHAMVFGTTATPNRTDKRSLMAYFEHLSFDISTVELITRGYLVPIKVRQVPIKIDLRGVKKTTGDLDRTQVAEAIKGVFGEVISAIQHFARLPNGTMRKGLIFLPLVETSQKFADQGKDAGLRIEHIDGGFGFDERRILKQRFADSEFDYFANAMLLNRGYDQPDISLIVNLRPTMSESLYRQMIGRGTRLFCPNGHFDKCDCAEKKHDLLILDFLYAFDRLGPMTPGNLIASTPQHAEGIRLQIAKGGEVDLLLAEESAVRDAEAALLRQFANPTKDKKKIYFDATAWAASFHVRELLDYEPVTPYARQAITAKQAERLENAGFMLETIQGIEHAEIIIRVLDRRRDAGLCSFKQAFWLTKFGVPRADQRTGPEAGVLLGKFFEKKNHNRH